MSDKELHDKIKSNPFWMGFDFKYFPEVAEDMYELEELVSRKFKDDERKTNPLFVTFIATCHDVNWLMGRLKRGWIEQKMDGDYTLILQTFLSNMHMLIDGFMPLKIKGYTKTNGPLIKLTAVLNDDGKTYRAVREISGQEVEAIVEEYKKKVEEYEKLNMHLNSATYKYLKSEIEKLERGDKLTESYLIV